MAEQDEWLELLEKEAVETFNGRRTERTRIELFAADLSEKKLAGVDLSNANLEKSDLTGTDLTDANLMKANLAGIDGSGAILRDALALRCRFKDAWMDDTELSYGDFTESDFADANRLAHFLLTRGHVAQIGVAGQRQKRQEHNHHQKFQQPHFLPFRLPPVPAFQPVCRFITGISGKITPFTA